VTLFYVMRSGNPERRVHQRFPTTLEIQVHEISAVSSPHESTRTIQGRLQNLSRGGLCILTDQRLNDMGIAVCEIVLPELPVPIPVLTNVRWSEERSNGGYGVLYGLQILY
jgi:hypothetical protein